MKTIYTFTAIMALVILQSCGSSKNITTETFWVSGTKSPCNAGAGKAMCMNISKEANLNDAQWQNFYAPIEGFTFEEGNYQKIEVTVEELDQATVPADGSSLKYTLNQVIETKKDETTLLNGNWLLVRLNTAKLNRMVSIPSMHINLSEKRISGNAGCNNYSAAIKNINPKHIHLSAAAMTKKACINKNIETEFGQTLHTVKSYALNNSELLFYNETGAEVLAFVKNNAETANINIHDIWVATSINGGKINRMVTAPRLEVNLTKMQIMGSDGCNDFTGSIKNIDSSTLEIGNVAKTQKACLKMETANQFNNALNKVAKYTVNEGKLTLLSNDDTELITFLKVD